MRQPQRPWPGILRGAAVEPHQGRSLWAGGGSMTLASARATLCVLGRPLRLRPCSRQDTQVSKGAVVHRPPVALLRRYLIHACHRLRGETQMDIGTHCDACPSSSAPSVLVLPLNGKKQTQMRTTTDGYSAVLYPYFLSNG